MSVQNFTVIHLIVISARTKVVNRPTDRQIHAGPAGEICKIINIRAQVLHSLASEEQVR